MALDIENPTHEHRPIGFVLLGLLLLSVTGYLFYDVWHRGDEPVASAESSTYSYAVKQSVDTDISYFGSSFYGDKPGAGNTAYIADLTDRVSATLHYSFKASREADLTSMYSATATVRAKYTAGAEITDVSNVWLREYPLIKPVTTTQQGQEVIFTPTVSIPYAEYRKNADQFKTTLAAPVTSEVAITLMVRIYGSVDGMPLDDVRVSTVTMPLDQPIFTLANKFEKEDSKQLVPQAAKSSGEAWRNNEYTAATVIAVFGLAAIVYGFRKKIFKTSYQRELERIYRYHDGIIIHARKSPQTANKSIVPVSTFDDILNLEEETKQPIVAYPLGGEATQFMIVKDDIVYAYTLGKELIDHEETNLQDAFIEPVEPRPVRHKKIQ